MYFRDEALASEQLSSDVARAQQANFNFSDEPSPMLYPSAPTEGIDVFFQGDLTSFQLRRLDALDRQINNASKDIFA